MSTRPLEVLILRELSAGELADDPAAAWSAAGEGRRAIARRLAGLLVALDARARVAGDPDYPSGLADLRATAPRVVFLRGGNVPEPREMVAIVGSRAASPYGLRQAGRLAGDLARIGLTVVSGLARGIDQAAHRGALDAGGRTVAVLPSGLDEVTPRHHQGLADVIAGQGTLLTEVVSGPPRYRGDFVKRNRLIAALAGSTVVVEAAARSGALSTAAAATRLGRPVLAVPGDLERETSRGCHALIRSGARLCTGAADVLEALGAWGRAHGESSPVASGSGSPEARLLEALGSEARTLETLAEASGLSIAETLSGLLALQWAGAAIARPGQRWARGGSPGAG
ncbi:MAG TPA: DNA-processing protein DprA [Candidatus Eisenbacteria bacterium]